MDIVTGECISGGVGGSGSEGGGGYPYTEPPSPCKKLQTIGKHSKTKTLMGNLKGATTSSAAENAYLLDYNGTDINETYQAGDLGTGELSLNITNPIDGIIHSHYAGLLSVFSVSDLATLAWVYKNGKIKNINTFVIGVVTASGTQYMMMIDDPAKFNTFAGKILDANNQFSEKDKDAYEIAYSDIYKIRTSSNGLVNEENFVKFIDSNNVGVKVFKGDSTFNNWQLLERNEDGTVSNKNCK